MNISTDHPSAGGTTEEGAEQGHGPTPAAAGGAVHLPPILPARPGLYATLRQTHTVLAYLLFATFLAHAGAVLFHTLVMRDGLLNRMVPWSVRAAEAKSQS